MPSAKKKNKVGHLTGGSDKEREALQLRTYHAHLQNNKALQGIAVSTDSIASPEQRTRILSLMNIPDEEGVLKKVVFYQLQNDRSVDLGKSGFSNPGSTSATERGFFTWAKGSLSWKVSTNRVWLVSGTEKTCDKSHKYTHNAKRAPRLRLQRLARVLLLLHKWERIAFFLWLNTLVCSRRV